MYDPTETELRECLLPFGPERSVLQLATQKYNNKINKTRNVRIK